MTIADKLREEGREEGREKGKRETTLKMARRMLNSGLDRAMVMKMTGLTEAELTRLRH